MLQLSTSRFYFLFFLTCVCFTNILAANTCPIPDNGKIGSKKSVVLSTYKCVQASSSKDPVCPNEPSSKKLLQKGQEVNLENDVNKYAVTAKFFGAEVCVAYRKKSNFQSSRGIDLTNECASECFENEETETYDSKTVCSDIGCRGGRNRLKFVISNSGISKSATTFTTILFVTIGWLLCFGFSS